MTLARRFGSAVMGEKSVSAILENGSAKIKNGTDTFRFGTDTLLGFFGDGFYGGSFQCWEDMGRLVVVFCLSDRCAVVHFQWVSEY
jgi:hypothetical protein